MKLSELRALEKSKLPTIDGDTLRDLIAAVEALQVVMQEHKNGYGLRCEKQCRAALKPFEE